MKRVKISIIINVCDIECLYVTRLHEINARRCSRKFVLQRARKAFTYRAFLLVYVTKQRAITFSFIIAQFVYLRLAGNVLTCESRDWIIARI